MRRPFLVLFSLLIGFCIFPSAGRGDDAPSLYWDIPTAGPSGSWNLTSQFWSQNSAGGVPMSAWVNPSDAVFSATNLAATGDFTVTLAAEVTVGDLTYRGGNLGSTLQIAARLGNTITMASSQMS